MHCNFTSGKMGMAKATTIFLFPRFSPSSSLFKFSLSNLALVISTLVYRKILRFIFHANAYEGLSS